MADDLKERLLTGINAAKSNKAVAEQYFDKPTKQVTAKECCTLPHFFLKTEQFYKNKVRTV